MKRRAKLSLRRSSQKLKKPNVIDYIPETQDYLNKAAKSVSGFAASLSTSACQETAKISGAESTSLDHPSVKEDTFLDEATDDGSCHGCDVGSQDHPNDMNCESVSVCNMGPGSGHQMESDRDMEECGDTDNAIPSSSSGMSCNSTVESDSEQVDYITHPTPEFDLCTHYYDDHSNPALYSLSSDDVAQFEDFSAPRRTERTQSNPSIKRQTSLLSFMSRTSRSNSESFSSPSVSSDDGRQGSACTSLPNVVMAAGKRKATNHGNSQSSRMNGQADRTVSESSGETSGRTKRMCPFYKRIPGTLYSSDAVLVL